MPMGIMEALMQRMLQIPAQQLEQEAMRTLELNAPNNEIAKNILDNLKSGNRQEAFKIAGNAANNLNIDVSKIRGMRR